MTTEKKNTQKKTGTTVDQYRFVLRTPIGDFYSEIKPYNSKDELVREMRKLGPIESWLNRIEKQTGDTWELV